MKLPLAITGAFSDKTNKEVGEVIVNQNLGLSINLPTGVVDMLRARVLNSSNARIQIGNTMIQMGRVVTSDTSFEIKFPIEYVNNSVFVILQPAGNDGENIAQVDGSQLPTSTGFNVLVTKSTDSGTYYWFSFGEIGI